MPDKQKLRLRISCYFHTASDVHTFIYLLLNILPLNFHPRECYINLQFIITLEITYIYGRKSIQKIFLGYVKTFDISKDLVKHFLGYVKTLSRYNCLMYLRFSQILFTKYVRPCVRRRVAHISPLNCIGYDTQHTGYTCLAFCIIIPTNKFTKIVIKSLIPGLLIARCKFPVM